MALTKQTGEMQPWYDSKGLQGPVQSALARDEARGKDWHQQTHSSKPFMAVSSPMVSYSNAELDLGKTTLGIIGRTKIA